MKRKLVLLAALLVLAVALFAACEKPLVGLDLLQQQYNDIVYAKSIKQQITISAGELVQFESSKTFAKVEQGYTVTGTERKLNDLDAETPFAETTVNEKVQSASGSLPTLKLSDAYFETGFYLPETGNSLRATVKQANIKDVFGVTGDLPAATDNLTLELEVSAGHVSAVRIAYDSEGSQVVISLTMTY